MAEDQTSLLYCGHARKPGQAVGLDSENRTYCQDCSERREIEEFLRVETKQYVGYMSTDGKRIETWTGGHLAHIALKRERRMPRGTVSVWAFDSQGRWWYGVGSGEGMILKVRQVKGL